MKLPQPTHKPLSKAAPLSYLRLGALTTTLIGLTAYAFRRLQPADTVPEVDALESMAPCGDSWPFVSIIVPARNEERTLPRLLPTLLSQHYPNYEVIVVDDQSTDATPKILAGFAAQSSRLKVVHGQELPEGGGWLGKPHAMSQGADVAHGEWLLFTDADTWHSPLSLSSSVAYALANSVDLLTILPCAELGTPSERLLMPIAFMGISTFYSPSQVNNPASKAAIANGQYMLIQRDVYDKVGGVSRVKDKIAEDLEFGKAVKHDGYRLYLADGRHLMSVRMYTSFSELWEGWSKNVVLSFVDNPGVGLLSALSILVAVFAPLLLIRRAVGNWHKAKKTQSPGDYTLAVWWSAFAAWSIVAPMIYRRRIDTGYGLPAGWTLTQPLGMLIFSILMFNSARRLLTGKGVTWKGRTYASH